MTHPPARQEVVVMQDWRDVPMPPAVAALPRDPRGYPILFSIQQDNGTHNFLAMEPQRVIECAEQHRCGVCGLPLAPPLTFIGGPLSLANRIYSEPPMHRDCFDYAYAVCPYLVNPQYRRVMARHDRPTNLQPDPTGTRLEAGRMAVVTTARYWFHREHGVLLFRIFPAMAVEWLERTGGGDE
jgi:hypothetical protein